MVPAAGGVRDMPLPDPANSPNRMRGKDFRRPMLTPNGGVAGDFDGDAVGCVFACGESVLDEKNMPPAGGVDNFAR